MQLLPALLLPPLLLPQRWRPSRVLLLTIAASISWIAAAVVNLGGLATSEECCCCG
jgi:hypothetical protein